MDNSSMDIDVSTHQELEERLMNGERRNGIQNGAESIIEEEKEERKEAEYQNGAKDSDGDYETEEDEPEEKAKPKTEKELKREKAEEKKKIALEYIKSHSFWRSVPYLLVFLCTILDFISISFVLAGIQQAFEGEYSLGLSFVLLGSFLGFPGVLYSLQVVKGIKFLWRLKHEQKKKV
jgi:hypothetical protein